VHRHDRDHVTAATERAVQAFPVLRDRWHQSAGTMSGGEQQMLNLSLALLAKPRLLLIDELSLGLAPVIVEQLLDIVRSIHATGTTVVVVEQSLTTALRLAERAVFLEKGEVRFSGPTSELLDRPDLLRAVFLPGTREHAPGSVANGKPVRAGAGRPRPLVSAPTRSASPALAVHGVTKRYGGIAATRDVTLAVGHDEILGLIGPNGAGKTTLFDLMSGFVPPDDGRVELEGVDVTGWSADRRARCGLGRSFQDARLWPSLTVAEAIAVACERHVDTRSPVPALLGLPAVAESEARVTATVDELIEILRLQAFRDKFVAELSTGSRRIVEIAAVLAHRPGVLLLDEPSSGVAQRETEALGPVLRDVRQELGCAIVIIDHDLPLVLGLVDRLAVLEQGALLIEGPPDVVMADAAVVTAYLGGADDELADALS
jgi:ABC-type branched-subunit amino acid transport system ATPase component